MRIVGGSHRGRPIIAPPDRNTRPTIDRVRESLFNMLLHSPSLMTDAGKNRLEGGVVLDPFAGSGALSFEALSRGAHHAYLFELDPAENSKSMVSVPYCKLTDSGTGGSVELPARLG